MARSGYRKLGERAFICGGLLLGAWGHLACSSSEDDADGAPATGGANSTGTGGANAGGANIGGESGGESGGASSGGESSGGSTSEPPDLPPITSAIHVSVNGSPDGDGSEGDPVDTFAQAFALRAPEDAIIIHEGEYFEQLLVEQSGTTDAPIQIIGAPGEARPIIDRAGEPGGKNLFVTGSHVYVAGLELRESGNQCVDIEGTFIRIADLRVHDCDSHGVQITGQDIVAERLDITNTVLENEGAPGGGWGSGLKVAAGGQRITLRHNRVYENWGEGIAVTRGVDAVIEGNWVRDNYSVNIYVDNSVRTEVRGNFATCTANSGFERDGDRPAAIAIGEEFYEGWGSQLADVTVVNNILAFCHRGLIVYEAETPGGGLDGALIAHNTFWGSVTTALSIPAQPDKTRDVLIAHNLVQQPDDRPVFIEDRTGIEMEANFWAGAALEEWQNGDGPDDLSGDPGLEQEPDADFVATFRLSEDSAAREAFSPVTDVSADLEGVERPGMVSAGALEYVDPSTQSEFDEMF